MTTSTHKIILDTNMILSASMFGGMVEIIIDLVFKNKLQLFVSTDLSKEVLKKLDDFHVDKSITTKVAKLLNKGQWIEPNVSVSVCRDPNDNFLLELAQTAKADFLITRDKDLLELPNSIWKNTKIIKPEDFLPLLRKQPL